MSWYFIVAGLVLIIVSIYEKIKMYNNKNKIISKSETGNNLDITAGNSSNQIQIDSNPESKNIDKKLDKIISELNTNRDEILNQIENNEYKSVTNDSRSVASNFQNILQKKYEKDEKNDQKLPEKYQKVVSLSREGKNAEEIAQELNIGIRETNIILKLYKQRKNDTKNNENKGQIHNVP